MKLLDFYFNFLPSNLTFRFYLKTSSAETVTSFLEPESIDKVENLANATEEKKKKEKKPSSLSVRASGVWEEKDECYFELNLK